LCAGIEYDCCARENISPEHSIVAESRLTAHLKIHASGARTGTGTRTEELLAVVNPAAVWKIQRGFRLLPPSRVSAPFKSTEDDVDE